MTQTNISVMTSGIYYIKNIITNKYYIGQAVCIGNRWKEHLKTISKKSSHSYNYPLYKAIRKYGIENFEFKVLENCSIELLNIREAYWISYYNSYIDGYNQTLGGDSAAKIVKLSEQDLADIIVLLQTTDISFRQLAKQFNCTAAQIRAINTGESRFIENIIYPIRKKLFNNNLINSKHYSGTCICQYLKNGDLIEKFLGYSEIEVKLKIKDAQSHISPCTTGKRKTAYGYIWKREKISKEEFEKIALNNNR